MRFALLLLLAIAVTTPAPAQEAASDQPSGSIAVDDSAQQDAAIAVRIRDILGELGGYDDVTVTVTSGIVTLKGQTLDSSALEQLGEIVTRVEGVVAIRNEVTETTDVVERLNPAVERFRKRAESAVAFLPLLLVAVAAFILIVLLGFAIARMRQPWSRLAPNAFIADIYRQVLRIAFAIAGLVIALDILGATALLSTILGAAGIIGLAIGFAVRDTVENFIASIMLSVRQPFRPNDVVEIEGDCGNVIRLTSRATILLSFDGNHIRIPNATVFKSRIINYTRNAERRFVFDLGIDPNANLALARDTAVETLKGLDYVLAEPAANAWIEDVGDSTVTLRCAGWIDQDSTSLAVARGEAIRITMAALTAADIAMPEPTFRVRQEGDQPTEPKSAPAEKAPPPSDPEPPADTSPETALDRLIEEERNQPENPDLLRTDALEE